MSKREMWENFLIAGEWGLKEEFKQLSAEEVASMTVDECIQKCYEMMFDKQKGRYVNGK